jgi:hypothetical protein
LPKLSDDGETFIIGWEVVVPVPEIALVFVPLPAFEFTVTFPL